MLDHPALSTQKRNTGAGNGELAPPSSRAFNSPFPLSLNLFGPMQVCLGPDPLPHLRSRKGLWLLAILALRGGRAVDRDWIAGTLWPECDEPHARRSLRQSLHDLRAALGSHAWRLDSDEPRTLHLDLSGVSVDALEFDTALGRGDRESFEVAVSLYRGPLLEDCAEEWALEGRRQREQECARALENLASAASSRQEYGVAANYLRTALRIDPYREDLQRALMEALAQDGNLAAALIAYRQYRALLGREMTAEPSAETTALFNRLRVESTLSAEPASSSRRKSPTLQSKGAASQRRTLPNPLTALIGREHPVREVRSLLASHRLLTLTGTGGVGKTRLAIQVALELSNTFPDGIAFVDLASLDNEEHLPDAIRIAIGASALVRTDQPVEELCQHLSDLCMVMVLDNCEHLTPACATVVEALLSRCAGLRILATSRQVLGVKGEAVWRVPSLDVPDAGGEKALLDSDAPNVSEYLGFAAIRLFVERARATESTFEITPKNAASIATICRRLDGIPLAIELAAARIKATPVEKIAARLLKRFRILMREHASQQIGPFPRQQTLRGSIDWSYCMLSDTEKLLLSRLSVFVGGWTLEAAEAVCSGDPIREWEILDLLTGVVEKSLVVFEPDQDRYRFLETIRQYVADRLQEDEDEGKNANEDGEEKEADKVRLRHLDHFLALAEAAAPHLTAADQQDWFERLERDHDNLREAGDFSIDRCRVASPEQISALVDKGLQLATLLWRFWFVRGHLQEGRTYLDSLLAFPHSSRAIRARALNCAGGLAWQQGEFDAARQYYEHSLAIRREIGDRTGMASTLDNLGVLALSRGEPEAARKSHEEGLGIYRHIRDQHGIAACLNNLGLVAENREEYPVAQALYEEALVINRAAGNRLWEANNLGNLGNVAQALGEWDKARSLQTQSLAIKRELGDLRGIAASLANIGRAAVGQGDLAGGRAAHREALSLRRQIQSRESMAESLSGFAELAVAEGDADRAVRLYGAAKSLHDSVGAPLAESERAEHDRELTALRIRLGDNAFDIAWREGGAMTPEQAVSFALS